ncbi:hypothetical protein K3495_g7824 [Podosphaera aphanis]|nr:hypothetical protein K3495_g7824 [Podosphaera aphanis]
MDPQRRSQKRSQQLIRIGVREMENVLVLQDPISCVTQNVARVRTKPNANFTMKKR